MKQLFLILSLLFTLTIFGQSQILDVLNSSPDYVPYKSSIDSSYEKCSQSWTTNMEWGACIGEHEDLWTKTMMQFYDSLMTELDTNGQRLLKQSQIDWSSQTKSQQLFWSYFEDRGYFGRENHFKAYEYDLSVVRNRALELQAYLTELKDIKEMEAWKKAHNK